MNSPRRGEIGLSGAVRESGQTEVISTYGVLAAVGLKSSQPMAF